MSKKKPVLYLVIPCYNEEAALLQTIERLKQKMADLLQENKIAEGSRVLFANDGSKDKTWEIIQEQHRKDKLFTGISLSRNRGHQNALLAGLMTAKKYADVVISLDADLQDDIDAIDEMLAKYAEGAEIVYGVRSSRQRIQLSNE